MMDKIKEWWITTPWKSEIVVGVVCFIIGAILF